MCCFSGKVRHVGKTKIFARAEHGASHQLLAYAMSFAADSEMAMILPIPTALHAGDDAVRFIDLSGYPTFFEELERVFPPPPAARGAYQPQSFGIDQPAKLKVHEVGHLEASFVPTVNDFARLDERFRLPKSTWNKLPVHSSYGFVVVKLGKHASEQNVHPIAFEFPRRDTTRVFFPTLHVHDGEAHKTAHFDHSLYLQGDPKPETFWQSSGAPVSPRVDEARAMGLIEGHAHAWKRVITGNSANDDIWV